MEIIGFYFILKMASFPVFIWLICAKKIYNLHVCVDLSKYFLSVVTSLKNTRKILSELGL